MTKLSRLAAFIAISALVSGCASITSGSSQTLTVKAQNAKTAELITNPNCTVADSQGNRYRVNAGTGNVVVNRNKGILNVNCSKPGFETAQASVEQEFNPWTIANVFFWPGIFVDVFTGAIQKYPREIVIDMPRATT